MYNKITRIIAKGLMLLVSLSLFLFNILTAEVFPPDTPVSIEINVSKNKIYVGDSIDVYATITLLKDHANYVEDNQYRINEMKTFQVSEFEQPLWKILYSDEGKMVSDNNPQMIFHFRQKLNRMPDRKNLYIEIALNPSKHTYATVLNPLADLMVERIEVTCLNEGLEYKPVVFPEDCKYRGEGSFGPEDFDSEPLEVDLNTPPKVEDLIKMNPELLKIEGQKVE